MSTLVTPPASSRPDYGIDAPGVRRGMLLAGSFGLFAAIVAAVTGLPRGSSAWVVGLGTLVAAYGLFMGAYMTYGSRIGKLKTRDALLDLAAAMRPWRGDECVLDVGCGRGLMLVGAALRLDSGRAIGIDLWRIEDQADNSPEEAMANARLEGVGDRVRIDTGDARRLPYADHSFDVVLSHWVVHNLPDQTDRERALDEMLRVLRPGGVLVVADIAHLADYRDHLLAAGVGVMRMVSGGVEAAVMGALSGGSYRPQALAAIRR